MELRREFHVLRGVRERYGFDRRIFSLRGNVVFPDLHSCRLLSARMNAERHAETDPREAVHTSDIYAMGLVEEIMHYMVSQYRDNVDSRVIEKLLARIGERVPAVELDALLARFVDAYPPYSVYSGEVTPEAYLESNVDGIPGREVALEEMLMLHLENENTAYRPFTEFFDDSSIAESSAYPLVIKEMRDFFASQPTWGPEEDTLVETLQAPMRHSPDSIEGQLRYIRDRWGHLIGRFLYRLLRGLDFLHEEQAMRGGPGGEPETYVYSYGDGEAGDSERFSPDRYWMPKVVLLAKTTLVWLDQLSRAWGREITRLDQVPDGELDTIASRGFTGLWLIGLWERSPASRRIKNLCGNPEAEASAYSLYDYSIADSLGGWDALGNLRRRCEARGIRLASDMVPNHSGIDSKWIHEHPEWFLQLDTSPYPAYSFQGENLSSHPGIQIYLEDHYYEKSDAAVVFKRVDGESERYIYHGNDGTTMPWNDTAQLDYLNPEVREAIIGTILEVARNFSIIRFDAAMTLAKKHIQRLWFPTPGSGGAIPSRAEHGLTQEEFDKRIPEEFWREVVDRVSEEVPDTLLLAEAFWMMESYFVRSLGMHRVYNSAFMNMLKNEENGKYRQTMKNTLEFDPQILKRFVNFMNNPDEETAVAQFGKGDKYFGVATIMLTMPGLPMFGHGQVEGFAEKYGMEYSRAYWDEQPDEALIERHNRELAPLAAKRWLFAEVDEFEMYDLHEHHGGIAESVFAYSNRSGDARTLVLYNNAYETVSGWIHRSSPVNRGNDEPQTRTVGEALGLSNRDDCFMIAREQRSGLWYLRNCAELHDRGMGFILDGYGTQVYLDVHEVQDSSDAHYRRLAESLDGAGVPDVDRALKERFLAPLHARFDECVGSAAFARVFAVFQEKRSLSSDDRAQLHRDYQRFAEALSDFSGLPGEPSAAARRFSTLLAAYETLLETETWPAAHRESELAAARDFFFADFTTSRETVDALLGFVLLEPLAEFSDPFEDESESPLNYEAASVVDDLMLSDRWEKFCGHPRDAIRHEIGAGLRVSRWSERERRIGSLFHSVFQDSTLALFCGVNQYNEAIWFDRDSIRRLYWWLCATDVLLSISDEILPDAAEGLVVPEYSRSTTDDESFENVVGIEDANAQRPATGTAGARSESAREAEPLAAHPDRPVDEERRSAPKHVAGVEVVRAAAERLAAVAALVRHTLIPAEESSGYRVEKLLENIDKQSGKKQSAKSSGGKGSNTGKRSSARTGSKS